MAEAHEHEAGSNLLQSQLLTGNGLLTACLRLLLGVSNCGMYIASDQSCAGAAVGHQARAAVPRQSEAQQPYNAVNTALHLAERTTEAPGVGVRCFAARPSVNVITYLLHCCQRRTASGLAVFSYRDEVGFSTVHSTQLLFFAAAG